MKLTELFALYEKSEPPVDKIALLLGSAPGAIVMVDKDTAEKVLNTGREMKTERVKMGVGTIILRIFKALGSLFARVEMPNGEKFMYKPKPVVESDEDNLQAWKENVKKKYPKFAEKMKFKGYSDKDGDTVCAEVPGMDRCFGVFDMDTMQGEVLGEGARGVIGAAIFGTVVGAGVLSSPKVTIDGNTYDKAIGTSFTQYDIKPKKQKIELNGKEKNLMYWTQPSGKHGRPVNLYYPLDEAVVMEKRPAGAPGWHDSDAPDAKGKFKELGINDLADWLIKTRNGDMQKINGSLQQQIIFNRKKNPEYAKKMESVREAVKRKLKKD